MLLFESKTRKVKIGDGETSAFMVYHESVKHIIPLYEASEENESAASASHNKRVSNVPHTIFCCRPPKSTFFSYAEGGEEGMEKAYFIGDRKENKHIFSFPHTHAASIISFDFTAKKRRHQNEIFYVREDVYYDLTMRCRNVLGEKRVVNSPKFMTVNVAGERNITSKVFFMFSQY